MPNTSTLPSRPARSLSPSRAADFQTCPLLYRFRSIDRLPEAPSPASLRGTLVHEVLEAVYGLPADRRTLDEALALIGPRWERIVAADPQLATVPEQLAPWLDQAEELVGTYFRLEDPGCVEPAGREVCVQAETDSGLVLRGFVDRLDRAPDGALRVVDYKTGRAPAPGSEGRAMFQLRFYALVLWHMYGRVPRMLQLMYLGDGVVLRYEPDAADLRATQRKVEALWAAISRAEAAGDFRPNPSRGCDWCAHQSLCPQFGGTPPPLPQHGAPRAQVDSGVAA